MNKILSHESLKTRNEVLMLLSALMVYVLMGVLLGSFHEEFFKQQAPCPFCYLQRIAFIGVALGALMNLRFGMRAQHLAFSLLAAFVGKIVSTRQILMHICPNLPQYGMSVLGFHLYTWAYIIFNSVIFAQILFLFFYTSEFKMFPPQKLRWWEKGAFLLVFLCTLGNMISVVIECGFQSSYRLGLCLLWLGP